LLILHTSTINVEFYSLSNTSYFIILCYIEQKIYLFLWRPAILSFKCPKKSGQQGSTRHLKVRTLKVNTIIYHTNILSKTFAVLSTQQVKCSISPWKITNLTKMSESNVMIKVFWEVMPCNLVNSYNSEMSATVRLSTWHNKPEDLNLNQCPCRSLKPLNLEGYYF